MTAELWTTALLVAVGLLAVYFLPRESKRQVPKITLVQQKRAAWKKEQ